MDDPRVHGNGYRLSARMSYPLGTTEAATRIPRDDIPSKVVSRAAASSTCDSSNANLCEKPVSGMTLPIVLGVAYVFIGRG